jgi:hypothetical protein
MNQQTLNHPINAFRIGNFKAFSDLQYILIRPLTLIYGANSSGKSSILHSLLLAHHAIKNKGELDIYRTEAGGDAVDLGGFGQYVYKHDRTSQIQFAVDVNPQQLNLPDEGPKELLKNSQKISLLIGIGVTTSEKTRVSPRFLSLEADHQKILSMSYRSKGGLKLDNLNFDHPIIQKLLQAIIDSQKLPLEITHQDLKDIINELIPHITAKANGFFPRNLQIEAEKPLFIDKIKQILDDTVDEVRTFFLSRLNQLIEAIATSLETEILKLCYLGPFRTYPPRHFAFSRQQDHNWDAGGGYAWDILLKDEQVREKVNAWLGNSDRMNTPYKMTIRHLIPDSQLSKDLSPIVRKELHDFLGSLILDLAESTWDVTSEISRIAENLKSSTVEYDDPEVISPDIQEIMEKRSDIDTATEIWIAKLNSNISDRISDLVLTDKRSNTRVSHRDIGIGVSQVIPILVSCYGLSDSLIAIEQPEIHLHPKLQAELGDVFIESALGEQKNRFILETHSEHLLLRIMRRMRETYNQEPSQQMLSITPEDVSILFVESTKGGTIVREMLLNERGELVKAWPGGFFEEELDEIF